MDLVDAEPWRRRLRLYSLFLILVALSSPVVYSHADVVLSAWQLAVHTVIVTVAVGLMILFIEATIGVHLHVTRQANRVSAGGLLLRAGGAYLLSIPVVGAMHRIAPLTRGIMDEHARAAQTSMAWYTLPVALLIVYVCYQAMRKDYLSRQVAALRRINDELQVAQRRCHATDEDSRTGRTPPAPAITVRANGMDLSLDIDSIERIASDENYCHIIAASGNGETARYMVRMTLREAVDMLPERQFLQTHRSHLVNLRRVAELIRDGRRRELRLATGDRVPVSRARIGAVQSRIGEFLAAEGSSATMRRTGPSHRQLRAGPTPGARSRTQPDGCAEKS